MSNTIETEAMKGVPCWLQRRFFPKTFAIASIAWNDESPVFCVAPAKGTRRSSNPAEKGTI